MEALWLNGQGFKVFTSWSEVQIPDNAIFIKKKFGFQFPEKVNLNYAEN